MPAKYAVCQSCGMPLKRDEPGGGTNADGSRSEKYCSHCYRDGMFIAPDLTAEQMRDRVIAKLRELHIPTFLGRLMSRNIAELERWRQSSG